MENSPINFSKNEQTILATFTAKSSTFDMVIKAYFKFITDNREILGDLLTRAAGSRSKSAFSQLRVAAENLMDLAGVLNTLCDISEANNDSDDSSGDAEQSRSRI